MWLVWAIFYGATLGVPIGSEHPIVDVNFVPFFDPNAAKSCGLHAFGVVYIVLLGFGYNDFDGFFFELTGNQLFLVLGTSSFHAAASP